MAIHRENLNNVQAFLQQLTQEMEPPLWIVDRMDKLGLDPSTWRSRLQGD